MAIIDNEFVILWLNTMSQPSSHSAPLQVSLFANLVDDLGDDVEIIRCTKATLVHISHQLEDLVLRHELPAMIFTGFQESSHWQQETARYRKLASKAMQVCIFAGKPLPMESNAKQLHVQLEGDDPLRQEWFLLILSPEFSSLLCGQDNLVATEDEATREFDTIWSFDVDLILRTLDMLENVIEHYRPDRIQALQEARRRYPPTTIAPQYISELSLEIVRYEEALSRELRWHQSLVDKMLATVPHHLYVAEAKEDDFTIIYESPNLDDLLGLKTDQPTLTMYLFDLIHVHPEDRPTATQHFTKIQQGQESTAEFRVQTPDNTYIWLRDTATTTFNASNRSLRVYGVIEDITLYRLLEQEHREQERLQILLEQEREYKIIKRRFTELVSHEFRTPLSSISTTLYMLNRTRDTMSNEQYEQRLGRIQHAVDVITQLMDEYMIVISNDFDAYTFNPYPVEPGPLIDEIIKNMIGIKNDIDRLQIDIPADLPQVSVDAELVQQIVVALLNNALRYSPASQPVEISARVANQHFILKIVDHGKGIPETDREQIFDAFYRGDESRFTPGLGMGLTIVQQAVNAHGGSIQIASEPKQGTAFTITLPTGD